MRLREGDPVVCRLPGGHTRRGRVLGFEPYEEWDAAKLRSRRFHLVLVAFPDGTVGKFKATALKSEGSPKVRNG